MIDPILAAADWLQRTYTGRVVVSGERPLAEGSDSWLVASRFADEEIRGLGAQQPVLASTVVVPKDGREPFPAANSAPVDEALNLEPSAPGEDRWRWRVNARGCLLAADAVVHGATATALPWYPGDERPDWWSELLSAYFPDAVTTTHFTWASSIEAVTAEGPGSSAVIWHRRRYRGAEITGQLLYAHYSETGILVLDPQRGMPASTSDEDVHELVVARFRRPVSERLTAGWQVPADDLASAIRKGTAWLDATYEGAAVLVSPSEQDRLRRGWLFACTTRRFASSGDWHDQMLDSALVVPFGPLDPFGLPNDDPWRYLERWDSGAADVAPPPSAGAAAWFAPTMGELGPVRAERHFAGWPDLLAEVATFPPGVAGVVWVRRQDRRGRETVGNLLVAVNDNGSPRIADSRTPHLLPPSMESGPLGLELVTYEATAVNH